MSEAAETKPGEVAEAGAMLLLVIGPVNGGGVRWKKARF